MCCASFERAFESRAAQALTTSPRRGWSLCSARSLFAPPPPRALGRQHLRDWCACSLPAARLPYASPPGPPARSLMRPPTHARASQAHQTRSPPPRSSRLERVGAPGAAWRVTRDTSQASAAGSSRARRCDARRISLGGRRAGESGSWRCGLRSHDTLRVASSVRGRGARGSRVNGGGEVSVVLVVNARSSAPHSFEPGPRIREGLAL